MLVIYEINANSLVIYALFQDPLNRAAAPPIMEKAKKPNKQQAASTADLNKQVVSKSFITLLLVWNS